MSDKRVKNLKKKGPFPAGKRRREEAGTGSGAPEAFRRPFRGAAPLPAVAGRAEAATQGAPPGRHRGTGAPRGARGLPAPPPPWRGGGSACALGGRRRPQVWGHVGRGVGLRWVRSVPQTVPEPRRALLAASSASPWPPPRSSAARRSPRTYPPGPPCTPGDAS